MAALLPVVDATIMATQRVQAEDLRLPPLASTAGHAHLPISTPQVGTMLAQQHWLRGGVVAKF